jgi:amidohydrolase
MVLEKLKCSLRETIEANSGELKLTAERIAACPELGFREYYASDLVAQKFREIGIGYRSKLAMTGVKAKLSGIRPGPTIAVLAEMDAVICGSHPQSDKETGASHACGHNIQIAIMLGIARAIVKVGAMQSLSGSLVFMAVPAEEYLEIEKRLILREQGKIEFIAGKPELVRLGEFDDIDIAILVHAGGVAEKAPIVGSSCNGFMAKIIDFHGRASHAGASPHLGINALNAATLAITGINALRETFRNEDMVRVHPIITKGGEAVSVVPDNVSLEMYIRANSVEAIKETAKKVDQAVKGSAMALSAGVTIRNIPGFLPMRDDSSLAELYASNLSSVSPQDPVVGCHIPISTDMGDLSHFMPTLHPYTSGITGNCHSKDFYIDDYDQACTIPAVAVSQTIVDLLYDDACMAEQILNDFHPLMSKNEYLAVSRSFFEDYKYEFYP